MSNQSINLRFIYELRFLNRPGVKKKRNIQFSRVGHAHWVKLHWSPDAHILFPIQSKNRHLSHLVKYLIDRKDISNFGKSSIETDSNGPLMIWLCFMCQLFCCNVTLLNTSQFNSFMCNSLDAINIYYFILIASMTLHQSHYVYINYYYYY